MYELIQDTFQKLIAKEKNEQGKAKGPFKPKGRTTDGKPYCFHCKKLGHIARNCFKNPESQNYKAPTRDAAPAMTSMVSAAVNLQPKLLTIEKNLHEDKRNEVFKILKNFVHFFALSEDVLGLCTLVERDINTGVNSPIHQLPFKSSWKERAVIQEQVEGMLRQGIIGHSDSPWSSPVIQVPVASKDRQKTAFVPVEGLYQFRALPFGLTNAPGTYQWNFSAIARPLTSLTNKDIPFIWGTDQVSSFNALKVALTSAPVLAHPNYNLPMENIPVACGLGIRGVLAQRFDGVGRPVAYASCLLPKSERNYSSTEKECLALVWCLTKFRCFVWGCQVKVISDHQALCWLMSKRDLAGRLAR
ncbi:Uncharacterized protein APZ42_025005 [Daphnia magna]|uniref:CCHC-type domain-containing protein n=1 Tax=Daphnia magna TaxID=35525 RepID=A0A164TJQ3_9CRUS|nr:Uncharacterized protein APZ42_025005 [Daphnia magna]